MSLQRDMGVQEGDLLESPLSCSQTGILRTEMKLEQEETWIDAQPAKFG